MWQDSRAKLVVGIFEACQRFTAMYEFEGKPIPR